MKSKEWDEIAKQYHDEIVSPLRKGVKNPLFKHLKEVKNSKKKIVADLGCGRGEILDKLALQFKEVYAADFSPKMIEEAKKLNKRKNISYAVKDLTKLGIKNKFDVVIAINSVLGPSIKEVKQSLKCIKTSLKKGGQFFGVFPAMEGVLYQGFLIFGEELNKKEEKHALKRAKRLLEEEKYDFVKGTYEYEGTVQKFYYSFELKLRLEDVGFKNIKLSKVLYPWGEEVSGYSQFPNRPEMWDWFVSANL